MERVDVMDNGDVVIANNQTHGRGQREHVWESKPGKNLTFSILYKNIMCDIQLLNKSILGAIQNTIKPYCEVYIKDPNDIYYDGRKLCGILVETVISKNKISNCVIGIGLNVNQRRFHVMRAISLYNIVSYELDRMEIMCRIIYKLNEHFAPLLNFC